MQSSANTHPWGIFNVNVDDPMGSDKLPITPWQSLKFHPVGLVHLRRYQGVFPYIPLFFKTKQASFQAADIAWFSAGLHKDGKHYDIQNNAFHSEFIELFNNCGDSKENRLIRKDLLNKVLGLIFDLATLLNRASGGTTLILHTKGTTIPGSPHQPEFLKADAYFPPAFLADHPACRPALLRIAQEFIEHIGVPTVIDWNRRARGHLKWAFSGTHATPPSNPAMTDVPLPNHGTSHFVFLGQPAAPGPDSLTQLHYQERIDALTAELDEVREERAELSKQLLILEKVLEIDKLPALQPQAISLKTPSRNAVSQRTPTLGPKSPFVTVRSSKLRSPFPATPSGTPAREPTTPPSCTTQTSVTRFASEPMASHGVISPPHGQVISPATTSSVATGGFSSDSIVAHILGRYEALHLKAKVMLLTDILSDPCDAQVLAGELEKLTLPQVAISGILKASILDKIE